MDVVFRALADPGRRELLDSLNLRNGQTLSELCSVLVMARQSVSKHLAVLEAAGLVTTVWHGREKLHYLNAAPINAVAERWIDRYSRERVQALADLKRALEDPAMSRPDFVYTTYITTTPQRLWEALTTPEFSRRYMGHGIEADWSEGAPYVWLQGDLRVSDPEQLITEYEPYRRLAFTFLTITPELGAMGGLEPETIAAAGEERRSTVVFDLEARGPQVKLTVTQGQFDAGSVIRPLIADGWPLKLSNLKTALEREVGNLLVHGRRPLIAPYGFQECP